MANKKSKTGKKASTKKKAGASGKKKTTASKKKTDTVYMESMETPKAGRNQLLDEVIWGLIFVAVGAFLFIATEFGSAGAFGVMLGNGLKGLFGVIGLVFPWYLIGLGLLMLLHKTAHLTWRLLVAGVILFMMLCLLNAGRFLEPGAMADDLHEIYTASIALNSGGLFGMYVGSMVVKAIGAAGLYLFSAVIAVICLLLMFRSPVSRFMEDMAQRREAKELRRQEQIRAMAQARLEAEEAGWYDEIAQLETSVRDVRELIPESAAPKPQEPRKQRKRKASNVLEYMKDSIRPGASEPVEQQMEMDVEPPTEKPKKRGKKKSAPVEEPVTVETPKAEPMPLEIEKYEDTKASAKEIAKGAAEIGRDLGVAGGSTALTKSVDKSETSNYVKPSLDLLHKPVKRSSEDTSEELKNKARLLEETMQSFNVSAHVVRVSQGPAVTRYEIQPEAGVKVSKIVGLSDDIALNLRAKSIRMEAPIPGKAAVGIEVENDKINMVTLREVVDSDEFRKAKSKITFAVGKDIAGKPIVADLKSMPHLLIAGSTGSGKSVCINSIITSILYKSNPDEVKMVLIDPKVVELGNYNGIPHLLIPVVTDPSKAAAALSWAVVEMTNRYKMFAKENVRDLSSYNNKMHSESREDEVMPQVVIIIDELADLMMAAPSQVEESICRLAQMARAAGMHLIVATQRPSVDVITGVIKANIPSRIAFAVSSQVDSRTILDMGGAEHLVGKGDMLFNPLGAGKPKRVQGTFVSDEEVEAVIEHVKGQNSEEAYSDEVMDSIQNGAVPDAEKAGDADELLPDAIECVVMQGQASVSMLQRRFRIGYNRAARIVDQMEARGIVGPQDGSRPRQVLMSEEEFHEMNKEINEG